MKRARKFYPRAYLEPTPRMLQVLAFMHAHHVRESVPATLREVSAHFGWASPNATLEHVKGLVHFDFLRRRGARAHAYVLTERGQQLLRNLNLSEPAPGKQNGPPVAAGEPPEVNPNPKEEVSP